MVPDAFEEKTLTLTGDIRRVKRSKEEEGAETPSSETTEEPEVKDADPEAEGEKTPVQESMVADTQEKMEAHPWDHPDAVSCSVWGCGSTSGWWLLWW